LLRHARTAAVHNPAHRADQGNGRPLRPAPSAPSTHRIPNPTRRRGITALAATTAVLASSIAVTAAITSSGVLAPTASAGELVANGTFETSASGWLATPKDDGTAPVALARVSGGHTGSYAARVSNTSAAAATTVLNDSPNSVASSTAGLTYTATAWIRASQANTSIGLRLMEYASSNALVASKQASYWATDTAWHQLTVSLVAARTGSSIDVNALAWDLGAGKSYLVDDVSVVPSATTTPAPAPAGGTAVPAGVLPAQGSGALFGYYGSGSADYTTMESKIGRKFDLIHNFKDFDATNNMWPTPAMITQSSQGRTIHIGWEMVSYDGGYDPNLQPAPGATSTDRSGKVQKTWTYKQVSNGSLDRYLDAVAAKVKATSYKFIVDIDPETDDRPDIGGTAKIRAAAGTRAEYVAAYRHIVDRFRAKGVSNILWGWTMSGWTASDPSKAWSLQQLWPGSSYVNVIMWDPYNHSASNWRSFGQMIAPFYNAIRGGLLDPVDANAKKLPLGLGEYGCIADPRRPDWFKAIPSQAKAYPALVSLGYFNSGSWAALGTDSTSIAAYGTAGKDAWFHTRG